jgi:hydrogenase maturation protein HypF
LLWAWEGERALARENLAPVASFEPAQRRNLARMLAGGLNCPLASGIGRLFDAVASLLDLRQAGAFEGQAAMLLEFAAEPHVGDAEPYPFDLIDDAAMQPAGWALDWGPMLGGILADLAEGISVGKIAARFHNGLIGMASAVARRADLSQVVLAGGCFQNRILLEGLVARLQADGFHPFWHRRVPPGDGSIALGQAVAAGRMPG